MAFSGAFSTILLLLFCTVYADYPGEKWASDMGRLTDLNKRVSRDILQLRTPPGVEKALSHGRKLAQRRNREIQQCSWNAEEEECVISEAAEIEIFSGSNNADAEYFADRLLCDNLDDQESCYDAGCLWSDDGRCSFGVTSREIANCFRNATVYLHRSQRDEICGVLTDELDCEQNSQCNWDDEIPACDLDFWNTLTGVPSNADGTPEGFSEVYAMMRRDSVLAFNEEFPTHRRIENNLEEVLEWRPPPFDCPEEFDPLVCEFAEPFMSVMPISIYCDTMYGRDWEACDEDDLCEVFDGDTRQCTISDEQLELALAEATQVYIDAIHDPFLRDVYELNVNCSRINRIAACESASCVWLDDEGCTVSNVQLRNAYLEDIDDDSHPVCHVFVVADRYGCEDIMEAEECSGDEHCGWDEYENACYPSEQAIINYILENDPDLKEEFDEVADACATQSNRRDCVNST